MRDCRLQNPISSDLDVMRPTLIGNLVQAAKRNADRGFGDGGLFEVGPVFKNATPEGQTIRQRFSALWIDAAQLGCACARSGCVRCESRCHRGARRGGEHRLARYKLHEPMHPVGIIPAVPAYCGLALRRWHISANCIRRYFAALRDAEGPMVATEIFFAAIPQSRSSGTAKPLLKLEPLQPVARDFAFVVDRDVTAAKLIQAIKSADKLLIRDVTVFDVYEGEHVGSGKKSVALNVTLQPTEKTLTDAEIDAIAARITAAATKAVDAVLRG